MAEIINTFVDNETLTDQNSLTHLRHFDEESDDSMHLIEPSLYCIMTNFINKINSDSCTLMSLKLISSIPKKNSAFCMKTSYSMNK